MPGKCSRAKSWKSWSGLTEVKFQVFSLVFQVGRGWHHESYGSAGILPASANGTPQVEEDGTTNRTN